MKLREWLPAMLLIMGLVFLNVFIIDCPKAHPADKEMIMLDSLALSASTADYYSGLRLPSDRFHEVNITGDNRYAQGAANFGSTVLCLWAAHYLAKHRAHWPARMLLIGVTGIHTYAAIHNWRLR